jgi:hypothetical protein
MIQLSISEFNLDMERCRTRKTFTEPPPPNKIRICETKICTTNKYT